MPITADAVFISSTFIDLQEHRSRVRDVIQKLGAIDVAMEKIGPSDNRPLDECLRLVKSESDLFVGIYAHRYGFVPDGHSVSVTEAEYDAATEKGLHRLIFIVGESVPWKPALIEDGDGKTRLKRFLDKLRANHIYEEFKSIDDLTTKVAVAVGKELGRRKLRRVPAGPKKAQRATELSGVNVRVPKTRADWIELRRGTYQSSRNLFLAHTLRPSKKTDQRFDVSVYLVQHKPDSTDPLSELESVEFFFGEAWGNTIFKVDPKAGQSVIGIKTSAYGPFLCTCTLHFSTGDPVFIHRYIDFEAGQSLR